MNKKNSSILSAYLSPKLFYSIFFLIGAYLTKLLPGQIARTIYHFFITIAQWYLHEQTADLGLLVVLHNNLDTELNTVLPILYVFGILYIAFRAEKPYAIFFKRWCTASFTALSRIFIFFVGIYAAAFAALAFYFGKQLLALNQPKPSGTFLKRIGESLNPIEWVKSGLRAFTDFNKAQDIFESINLASFLTYSASIALDVLSVIIFFMLTRRIMQSKEHK